MAEQPKRECCYKNPITGSDCQFTPFFDDPTKSAAQEGRNYCWWHLPVPYDEKAHLFGGLSNLQNSLRDYAHHRVRMGASVDLSGLNYSNNLLDVVPSGQHPEIVLDDITIDGDLALTKGQSTSFVRIRRARITGGICLQGQVSDGILLQDVDVGQDVEIQGPVRQELRVENCRIRGNVEIKSDPKGTRPSLHFAKCRIDGNLVIEPTLGAMQISFRRCILRESFNVGHELSDCLLQECRFRGATTIIAKSDSSLHLDNCRLRDELTIIGKRNEIQIKHSALFNTLTFGKGGSDLLLAKNTHFAGVATSNQSVTFGSINLLDCYFFGNLAFQSDQIRSITSRSTYYLDASFRGCSFEKLVDFSESSLHGELNLSWDSDTGLQNSSLPVVRFRGASLCNVIFDGRKFSGFTDFLNAKFGRAPSFHNCVLHESILLPNDPNNYLSTGPEDEARYRTLKQHMDMMGSRTLQGLFFALEQRSARKSTTGSYFHRAISYFYDKTSEYGYNAARPFGWLLLMLTLAGGAYSYALGDGIQLFAPFNMEAIREGFSMSLRQLFTPFFELRSTDRSLWWQLAWVVQSIVSLALVAEVLLAIRWRFRRG